MKIKIAVEGKHRYKLERDKDGVTLVIEPVKEGENRCPNCGAPPRDEYSQYCYECFQNWPGDPGNCECRECGRLYERSSPDQSPYECSRCEEYHETADDSLIASDTSA